MTTDLAEMGRFVAELLRKKRSPDQIGGGTHESGKNPTLRPGRSERADVWHLRYKGDVTLLCALDSLRQPKEWRVAIEVGADATREAICEVAADALSIRDDLLRITGSRKEAERYSYLSRLDASRRPDWGYGAIAKAFNQQFWRICSCYASLPDVDSAYRFRLNVRVGRAVDEVARRLGYLKPRADVEALLSDTFRLIKQEADGPPQDWPVSREVVKQALRRWRKSQQDSNQEGGASRPPR